MTAQEIQIKQEVNSHPKNNKQLLFIIQASIASFITYLSMYAFRKPFTAASFDGITVMGVDYKILLIIAQLLGYTLSKYLGIKVVSEMRNDQRVAYLFYLMGFAYVTIFFFGLLPPPYGIIFMFLNGIPLGMIWGVVFSFLEGRKSTELLGAVMASSFIISSGLVKAVGKYLLVNYHVSETWMPFITASLFLPVLIIGIQMLKKLEEPSESDKASRTMRVPMNITERKNFTKRFGWGILLTVGIYVCLTVFRDMRDNFAVEFWTSLGYGKTPEILVVSELPIAFCVLIIIACMIMIKNNGTAFFSMFHIIFFSGLILVSTTLFFNLGKISPVLWMILSGFAMYLPYIGFHALLFERWIAHFRYKSNIGFLMYTADAAGYFGSMIVLLYKNFGSPNVTWIDFFKTSSLVVGFIIALFALFSFLYFRQTEKKELNSLYS
jgi:hypothetical protein